MDDRTSADGFDTPEMRATTPTAASRIPRSWPEWRARILDAMHFGERVAPPPVPRRELGHRAIVLGVIALITGVFVAMLALPGVALFGKTVREIAGRFDVDVGPAELPQVAQRSVVVDRNGKVLATLAGEENRIVVPLASVPKHAQNAVLAIEDASFYEHKGVDLSGLMRALLTNVKAGGLRQGGSTITQQLVKNTIVGTERSLDRKIREARLAVELERTLGSKRKILELYLNETYFGNGVYGIGTAAEYYFGKKVQKLTLAESALLAGIIKAPEDYEPLDNPQDALRRRNLVLKRMLDLGWISPGDAAAAQKAKIDAKAHRLPEAKTPYFVEYIKAQVMDDERFGDTRAERAQALFQAGLRIETTIDLKLQRAAQQAVERVLDRKGDPDAALASIDPKTGHVIAVVGGRDFDKQKYDLAVQGKRQPGSTFKTMTLVAALEAGIPPGLTLDTPSPLKIKDQDGKPYPVNNYDREGRGYIDMREATAFSVNTYYVQLIQKVGPAKVVDVAERMGVRSPLKPYVSLALGTLEVSPLDMASAYATMASGGMYCEPISITKISDPTGRVLMRNEPKCERRFDKDVMAQATSILRSVPEEGTGRTNGRIGRPVTGKTGTTENLTDAWYAGYTPQVSTVVWIGYRKDLTRELVNIHGLPKVFGGTLPAMIWNRFMRAAHDGLPVAAFPKPPGAETVTVPDVVGKTVEEALAILDEAKLSVRLPDDVKDSAKITAQDVKAGEEVAAGTLVTLTVSGVSPASSPAPSSSPSPSPSPTQSKTKPPKPSPTPTATKDGGGGGGGSSGGGSGGGDD